jgi:hypothetical protein
MTTGTESLQYTEPIESSREDEQWNAWAERHIDGLRKELLTYTHDLLTELVAQMRAETTAEIKRALGRERKKQQRSEVVDLPASFLKRRA